MKSFIDLERALFAQLVELENKLLLKLVDLRVDPLYVTAIQSIYQYALDKDGNLKYSRLLQKIDRNTAKSLQTMQEELLEKLDGDEFAEVRGEYPLSVMDFDQLNRIDAVKAIYGMADLKTAMRESVLIREHFEMWADTVFAMVETYYGIKSLSKIKVQHDFEPQLYHQRLTAGLDAGKRASLDLLRAMPVDKAIDDVTGYLAKKDKQVTDRIVFTEGTTVTEEVAVEAIKDRVQAFRSISVKDGKTCADCKAIETEQEANPVPIDNYMPGVTAPPFHPYCRCWIDFVEVVK